MSTVLVSYTELTWQIHVSPEKEASWFSYFSFSWYTPLVNLGNRKPLDQEDLWDLNQEEKTDAVCEEYKKIRYHSYSSLYSINSLAIKSCLFGRNCTSSLGRFWFGNIRLHSCPLFSPFLVPFFLTGYYTISNPRLNHASLPCSFFARSSARPSSKPVRTVRFISMAESVEREFVHF